MEQRHPEAAAEDLYDLLDEAFAALVDDDLYAGPEVAHRLGGYLHFTQADPRFDPGEPELAPHSEIFSRWRVSFAMTTGIFTSGTPE